MKKKDISGFHIWQIIQSESRKNCQLQLLIFSLNIKLNSQIFVTFFQNTLPKMTSGPALNRPARMRNMELKNIPHVELR